MKCRTKEFMVRDFCIQNFPFIAEDFDALTTYELLSKVICFLREIGVQVEELTKAMNDLKDDFEELYDYVMDYLNNIQGYINEKLDELAENGVLKDLLEVYMDKAAQCDFLKNSLDTGEPYLSDGSPVTVAVENGYIDEYIQYYEVKCFKDYHDCWIFEPDSTAPQDMVVNTGDMRTYARSMMEYQYNSNNFVASNGGLPGWYLFPNGKKILSDRPEVHDPQGWFYLCMTKAGDLEWIENGNNHDGTELNTERYKWGMPIWSPVRVNGVNVCTDNFSEYASYENIVQNRHPRTLLCIDLDDKPSLVIIPGRSSYAPGANYAEMMHMPEKYKHIFNFDGGGSSVLLVGNITMCPSWRYTTIDWRHNVSIFKLTPNEEDTDTNSTGGGNINNDNNDDDTPGGD